MPDTGEFRCLAPHLLTRGPKAQEGRAAWSSWSERGDGRCDGAAAAALGAAVAASAAGTRAAEAGAEANELRVQGRPAEAAVDGTKPRAEAAAAERGGRARKRLPARASSPLRRIPDQLLNSSSRKPEREYFSCQMQLPRLLSAKVGSESMRFAG